IGKPCAVPPGMSQALDQAYLDRVERHAHHHNGDRGGRLLGSQDHRVSDRHDDVNVATDEVSRQLWEEGDVPCRIAVLQDDVLPLDVSQLTQALLQGFVTAPLPDLLRTPGENPNAIAFSRLLCYGGERRHEDAEGE